MGLPLGTDTLRAGGGVIALQGVPVFPVNPGQKLPRPSALIFTSAAPRPAHTAHCSALGPVAGFRPPRPRLSGVSKGDNKYEVNRIEPSGQGIAPSHAPHMALALAEQVGFEPTHDFHRLSVFKTVPLSTWVLFRIERTGEW